MTTPLTPTVATIAKSYTALPHTPNCRRLLSGADHLLIGVSPGNSYYRIPTLARMLRWAHATFQRVDVIVPDRSLAANYRAQGYPEQVARKKARTEISSVRRRVRRAFESSGIPEAEQRTHQLSELAQCPAYRALHQRVRDALATDEHTRRVCREVTARAVTGSQDGRQSTQDETPQADPTGLALEYLIDELPFFIDTPSILGVPTSLASYHAPVPFADLLYTENGPLRATADQGLVLLSENSAEHR
ncbi:tRNA-dependent cyclodipeptide synthase [Streptomyces sp. NPDC052496]|uniref:tRNA-dependent cyclodipeptide synthase n=1 Tax=Streptomyces sp. NPDC052496 TaxID=3154951 RepID=UPI00341908F5